MKRQTPLMTFFILSTLLCSHSFQEEIENVLSPKEAKPQTVLLVKSQNEELKEAPYQVVYIKDIIDDQVIAFESKYTYASRAAAQQELHEAVKAVAEKSLKDFQRAFGHGKKIDLDSFNQNTIVSKIDPN